MFNIPLNQVSITLGTVAAQASWHNIVNRINPTFCDRLEMIDCQTFRASTISTRVVKVGESFLDFLSCIGEAQNVFLSGASLVILTSYCVFAFWRPCVFFVSLTNPIDVLTVVLFLVISPMLLILLSPFALILRKAIAILLHPAIPLDLTAMDTLPIRLVSQLCTASPTGFANEAMRGNNPIKTRVMYHEFNQKLQPC